MRLVPFISSILLVALSGCGGATDGPAPHGPGGDAAPDVLPDTPPGEASPEASTEAATAICGNGVVEHPELCDGDCPSSCDDGDACTVDTLLGSSATCDAVCEFVSKQAPDCASLDGCCPAGCTELGDADCLGNRPGVVLVIGEPLRGDADIRARIDRYQADHALYEFHEIPYQKDTAPLGSMDDRGGAVKRNWLEIRNTILDLQAQFPRLIGVWVIASELPAIWRDESIFDIPSGFKPSLYPLVATAGDYYVGFDPEAGGFTEVPGATTGKGSGDGYPADLWGAALVPVAGWGDERGQIIDFFDRNHDMLLNPPGSRKLLYADTFAITSRLAPRIDKSAYFSSQETTFLGPNSHPDLSGFSSLYNVMVHKQGPDFVPAGSSACVMATGPEQMAELDAWAAQTWFPNQLEFRKIGDDRCYFFELLIGGESIPPSEIRATLEANLPPLVCGAGDCFVHVHDWLFTDAAGVPIDGNWNAFPDQMAAFHELYTQALTQGDLLYSYISTHGAPVNHHFDITSWTVHDNAFSALVYELQACSTADYAATDFNIAGTYLMFGQAQAVVGYAQPSVIQCTEGDCFGYMRFLNVEPGKLVVDALFDRNYSMHVYLGDPLLVLP
jgi:hypothetical protein